MPAFDVKKRDGNAPTENMKRDDLESKEAAYFDVEFEAEGRRDVSGLGTPGDKRRRAIPLPGLQDDPHGEFDSGKRYSGGDIRHHFDVGRTQI